LVRQGKILGKTEEKYVATPIYEQSEEDSHYQRGGAFLASHEPDENESGGNK